MCNPIPIPNNEQERLQALLDYNVLDTLSEAEFDNITKLASYICDTPIALISLIDEKRQWFKSAVGLAAPSTPREISFCQHAIMNDEIFEVENALDNDKFKNNILVTGAPDIRFYAGAPLKTPEGFNIGTLCVIDTKPKKLSPEQRESLLTLSTHVINILELRKSNSSLVKKFDETIESHQLLQKLSVEVPGAIYQYHQFPDGTSCFPFTSKNIYDIYEVYPEEIKEDSAKVFTRIHPEDALRIGEFITNSFEKLEVWSDEYRVTLPNKGERWIKGKAKPAKLEDGSLLWHGYLEDITESKNLSNQVAELVSVQKSILDGANYSIIYTDIEGTIVNINRASLQLLEYEEEEVLNILTPAPFHDPTEVLERSKVLTKELGRNIELGFETFVAKARELNCADANEWTYISKSGKRIPVWLSVTCIRDNNNKLIGYLGIAEDYTLKKQHDKQLIASKRQAEKASSAKDIFLANMSHEIRTPLNAVIGFTDLLQQTNLEEKQIEYVESVKTAGENLLTIINEILDISKIESGKLELESRTFGLNHCIKHSYSLLKNKAQEKGIKLNLLLDAELPEYIQSDKTRLNQILINLVGNAIKFTREGSVTIEVRKIKEIKNFAEILFKIKDTGIGISPEKINTVFERFTQAEGNTTREFGGTGLGLNIVKQLVNLLGGDITVSSELGIGSEFSFQLKFKTDCKIELEESPSFISAGTMESMEVLLCEDNILNQKLASNVIQKFGYGVTIANNGQEGIKLLKDNHFDVVIMDLQMPVMDGYQATEYIRKELKRTIPIIAMTAHSFAEEKNKCLSIGMDDYITKPFKREDLYNKIKEVSKKHKNKLQSVNVDLSYLKELSDGDEDFEQNIIETFIEIVPKDLLLLKKAFNSNEPETAGKLAHKLKSSIQLFNMNEQTTILDDIENNKESFDATLHSKFKELNDFLIQATQTLKK